jgi:hypothetical protein
VIGFVYITTLGQVYTRSEDASLVSITSRPTTPPVHLLSPALLIFTLLIEIWIGSHVDVLKLPQFTSRFTRQEQRIC